MRRLPLRLLAPTLLLAAAMAAPASAQDDRYTYVRLSTNMGDMLVELDAHRAPITVKNYLQYVDAGFYDNTLFHRVIDDFMIQGGGFATGYIKKPTREQIQNEADNGLKNLFGTIAMARTNAPHSATSQFFINVNDNAFLDHTSRDDRGWGYCVFGKLIDGTDTLNKIKVVPTEPEARVGNQPAPTTPVVIEKAERVDPAGIAAAIEAARAGEKAARADAAAAEQAAAGVRDRLAKLTEELGDAGLAVAATQGADVAKGSRTASGLWMCDMAVGEGTPVAAGESVTVHYTGWLTDGTKFDSSKDRGQPITFGLNQVIKGWGEGVVGMKPGGKRFLVIPYQLAYGESGRPPTIPAKATLVFEIDLMKAPEYDSLEKGIDYVRSQGVDVSKGQTTDSGLWYVDLVEGQGASPAGPSTTVSVHYTGWLNDGTKFDSSRDRGQPIDFALNQVIKGWTEGVGSMKVGGRRYLVIPYAMAYGPRGRPPTIPAKATLVFDVELLNLP